MPCFNYNRLFYDTYEEAEEVADEVVRHNKGIYEAWVDYEYFKQ